MKKYYWYSQTYRYKGCDWKHEDLVCDVHPFEDREETLRICNEISECVILNWREITEEDYNLFKKMENE